MVHLHAGGEFRGILAAVGENHELAIPHGGRVKRWAEFAEDPTGQDLRDPLDRRSMLAQWRTFGVVPLVSV